MTFYRTSEELPDFKDYSMKNRTYRYMKNEALYPFGYGLSYTKFELGGTEVSGERIEAGQSVTVRTTIKNTGNMEGAEKVTLKPGESREITLTLNDTDFALYNEEGVKVLEHCDYEVYVGTSQPDGRSLVLTGSSPEKFVVQNAGDTVVIAE